ncbi:MAG: tetratricopeptide repeat protein, partial [Anaerolineales bacterium]
MNADQGKPTHFSSSLIAGVELALVGAFIRLSVFFIFQRFSVEFDLSPGFSIIDILFAALIGFIAGYRAYRRGAQSKRGRFLSGMISTIVLFEIYFALDMTGITRGIFPSNSEVITRISFTNLLWDLVYIVPIGIPIGLIAIPAPRVVEWFLEEKPVDHQPSASELAALHPGQHADDSGLPGPETFPEEVLPGYKLIQTGQPAQALRWLARYIKQRPKSEHAWLLLAYCLDDPQRRSESLKRVLKINPANKYAQSLMREIQNQTAQPLSTPTSETDGAAVTSVDVEARREPKTKLHLVVTAVAMVLLTIWPFMLASISAFRFRLINQDVYVRNTTLLTTLPVGLILLREGVNQVRSFLKNGAITGAMVGFVDNLVISIA